MGIMRLKDFSDEIVKLVSKVSHGVVSIITTRIGMDAFLRTIPIRGIGSGFVISEKGYIITNNHVVAQAEEVTILLSEGEKVKGKVVNRDPGRDLALLYVAMEDIKPLRLGDSDDVRVGEIVLAIGSPLGLPGPNVSIGVVSAVKRNIRSKDMFLEDLIQTDAAVNPGNSGGPLINMDGEVIGITTAMVPYAQGISFAIPINAVKSFMDMLIKYGRPVKPWIGIYIVDNNPSIASYYRLPTTRGVIIVDVQPESPAYDSGLKIGDIIIGADDKEINYVSDLRKEIYNSLDKGYVKLKVLREGVETSISVPIIIGY